MQINNKRSNIDDGLVNILLVEYTPNILDYGNYLALFSQKNNKYLHWYSSKEILLEFEEDIMWTLDGEEINGKNKAHIVVNHKALEMFY